MGDTRQIKAEQIQPKEQQAAYAQVVVLYGEGHILEISVEDELVFGKDSQHIPEDGKPFLAWLDEDIQCRIQKTPAGYVYHEPKRTGQILFNGQNVSELEPETEFGAGVHPLKEGDVIHIVREDGHERETIVFVFHERGETHIQWNQEPLQEEKGALYISRHEEQIEDGEIQQEEDALPKHYAVLTREGSTWCAEDHSTLFGVFVNNRPVLRKQPLRYLDILRIGHTLFVYREDALIYNHKSYHKNQLKIDIRERSVREFFRKKILLEDIHLDIQVGEMVLVLGGSGAGKTTFINAVMGYEKADGTILEGDYDIYRQYNKMKYDIGFVPQQDLLRLEDSVYDTLDNAAQMKMPANTPKEERQKRIEEILEMFGLSEETDSLVEKLSGGQRKRLSIAVEFVAKPSLFFLDEPDSGLDGVMARHLMENLRIIADQDKIVIIITHSPDRAADLFDKVVVLAKGNTDNIGHLAFYGTIDEAKAFFETDTLEEIIKRINREEEGGEGRSDEFISRFAALQERG